MTLGELNEACKANNIPDTVLLLSDSGWECCETDMGGLYYSEELNMLVVTQDDFEEEYLGKGWFGSIPKGAKFKNIKIEHNTLESDRIPRS